MRMPARILIHRVHHELKVWRVLLFHPRCEVHGKDDQHAGGAEPSPFTPRGLCRASHERSRILAHSHLRLVSGAAAMVQAWQVEVLHDPGECALHIRQDSRALRPQGLHARSCCQAWRICAEGSRLGCQGLQLWLHRCTAREDTQATPARLRVSGCEPSDRLLGSRGDLRLAYGCWSVGQEAWHNLIQSLGLGVWHQRQTLSAVESHETC
mmetsp:Transcript_65044/g.115602  ORF Transcript_65044/g.115602 Transcript_65044/m.115602 type:complete len:210 (+) Transcript_65044:492-1121(+)